MPALGHFPARKHSYPSQADAMKARRDANRAAGRCLTEIYAHQLIEPLRAGLAALKAEPKRFEAFNASNGWGLYEHFVPFVEKYLVACEAHPKARVGVSR